MPNIIVSTVGTSLLTKQINFKDAIEPSWNQQLRDSANERHEDLSESVSTIIETLKNRASDVLSQSGIAEIRRASAELNGIYGHYENNLSRGKADLHFLIATDTAQGQTTAGVVADFLRSQHLNVDIYTPSGLSTANTEAFSEGIDDLIVWLQNTIKPLRASSTIYFNLVGGFKSLQGYMNTIGMFYADEILYIFEGAGSELITIPRLPIQIDSDRLAPHAVELALMDAGAGLSPDQVDGIPEAMLGEYAGKKILSTWGKLTWDEAKTTLLSQDLLSYPKLTYTNDFRRDYNTVKNRGQRAKLQSVLASISYYLTESNGNPGALPSSINYTRYTGTKDIDHFRVDLSLRVSCRKVNEGLELRYYGTHDHVERSDNVR